MAIISPIGRRSFQVRLLIWSIYAALIMGAVTMLYPFMLMVAGSTKSSVDSPDAHVIPPYLMEDLPLYQKYIEGLFNESLISMRSAYDIDVPKFGSLELPEKPNLKMVDAWKEFLVAEKPSEDTYLLGFLSARVSRGVMPHNLRSFKRTLTARFKGDVKRLNREMKTDFVNLANAFYVIPKEYLLRRDKPSGSPFALALREFKGKQPVAERYYFCVEGFFKTMFLKTQYTKNIDSYNKSHGTDYESWSQVHLDRRYPDGPGRTDKERKDWEDFVRNYLNLLWVRADSAATGDYQNYLRAKYRDINKLNEHYGTAYADFSAVPLVEKPPVGGLVLSDWDAFLQGWRDPDTNKMHRMPAKMLRIHSLDFRFRDYLQKRYGSLAALNMAMNTGYADWLEIIPPQRDFHYLNFKTRTRWLRWEFTKRNFITVIDYVVLHGRAVFNTALYCLLQILCALTINPLAAYALSRYRPPSAYKILLFLMLTMAFPPMVTQIPVFLMLRQFSLLNSFWALILPGMANGYSIFLLKGFFDSLPRELYESAEIDGAGEFRIFWQITMSLSTPILAVIALNAFTLAYSNFMMALLICQDERMWTLMPWLYQLQQQSGQGVVFASLLVAAIPTFLVFAFCQNIIMRGIVVPVEK